jgi:hypothetical protein
MQRTRALVLLMSLVAVVSCETPTAPTLPQDVADFVEMRDLWIAQGIDDYDIDLSIGSEVTVETTLRFEVRGSVTTRVFDLVEGWRAPRASELKLSIDSLYARMAVADTFPELNVTTRFDTRNGLLTYSAVDNPAAINDAYWYIVRKFKRR